MPEGETITVTYIGDTPFVYGGVTIKPGDKIDLPAEEVQSWGTNVPPAFQK